MQDVKLFNLTCADCAQKIEENVRQIPGIKEASLHFPTGRLRFQTIDPDQLIESKIRSVVKSIEPAVDFSDSSAARRKTEIIRLLLSSVFFVFSLVPIIPEPYRVIPALLAWIIAGYPVLFVAMKNIIKLNFLDEFFLMSTAGIGAIALGQYPEAAGVMLFYGIGEFVQDLAVNKSRSSIESLLDVKPDHVVVLCDGMKTSVSPETVEPGSFIEVLPGETFALDGLVVEGTGAIDEKMLTGESLPKSVEPGDSVRGGSVNLSSRLVLRTTATFDASSLSAIIRLTTQAAGRKNKSERFITRFARIYTPSVMAAALVVAFVIPLLTGGNWNLWIHRALVFLIISCPCALVVSVPLAWFAGIGAAAKAGLFVKGSDVLDGLSRAKAIAFDKTGTITDGKLSVTGTLSLAADSEREWRPKAYALALCSTHPVSQAIVQAGYGTDIIAQDSREIPGLGTEAYINGERVSLGSRRFLESRGVEIPLEMEADAFFSSNGKVVGGFVLSDEIRPETSEVMGLLKKSGIHYLSMLTGDKTQKAETAVKAAGLDAMEAGLLPGNKLEAYGRIKDTYGTTVFVGDGFNDAPVLAAADIGVSMGLKGSKAAIEASDAVILAESLFPLARGRKIARFTSVIVVQNIILALTVKTLVLVLGVAGLSGLWEAVFADVGTVLLAVLNASRILVK